MKERLIELNSIQLSLLKEIGHRYGKQGIDESINFFRKYQKGVILLG